MELIQAVERIAQFLYNFSFVRPSNCRHRPIRCDGELVPLIVISYSSPFASWPVELIMFESDDLDSNILRIQLNEESE